MTKEIETTGDLRDFLSKMLVGIKNGDIDVSKAAQITKMAAQINESFYSEVKVTQTLDAAKRETAIVGKLLIGGNE